MIDTIAFDPDYVRRNLEQRHGKSLANLVLPTALEARRAEDVRRDAANAQLSELSVQLETTRARSAATLAPLYAAADAARDHWLVLCNELHTVEVRCEQERHVIDNKMLALRSEFSNVVDQRAAERDIRAAETASASPPRSA